MNLTEQVEEPRCQCVTCADCNGTGRLRIPTMGYRGEEEHERCPTCRGIGYEMCEPCREKDVEDEDRSIGAS